jgi:mannose-6-phosphate isomerase-like protein (cupin superfamily)
MAGDISSWAQVAGRAAHPANAADGPRPGPEADVGDAGADLQWLWSVVSGLAAVTTPWEADDGPATAEQETLIWTPAYEVVLQRWPAGRPGDLHDHGLSHAAFCVVDGVVQEVLVDERSTRTERWAEGEGSVLRAGTLHRISNAGPGPATTVNVYAPPLHEVTSYGPAAEGGLTVLGTKPVGGDGPGAAAEGCPPA